MASSHRPSIYRIADAVMLVLSQPSTKVECPAASFECCISPKWWRKANLRTVCSALVYPETGAIWPGSQVPGSGLQEIHQTRHPSCVTARVFALPMEFTDDIIEASTPRTTQIVACYTSLASSSCRQRSRMEGAAWYASGCQHV